MTLDFKTLDCRHHSTILRGMARPLRIQMAGGFYHVQVVCQNLDSHLCSLPITASPASCRATGWLSVRLHRRKRQCRLAGFSLPAMEEPNAHR